MINKNKSIIFIILILTYIIAVSFSWPYIQLPVNDNAPVGFLSLNFINPMNDSLRFAFFLIPPLLLYILFLKYFKKDCQDIKSFFYFKKDKKDKDFLYLRDTYWIILLLFSFVLVDFFQQDFPNIYYLDSLHDGDYLAAFKNIQQYRGYWSSAFTVHGGENIFIPLIADYFFGFSITNLKYTLTITILLLKILSIFLAFEISQLSSSNKNYKIIFFTLLSLFLLSLSNYTKISYINIRDLFVLVFFIFLIKFYLKKNNFINNFLISFSAVFGFIFHYDTGTYMHIILLFVCINLLLAKQIKIFSILFFSIILNWIIIINFFGLSEIKIMLDQFFQLAKNIDYMHGLEYPRPFFSLGDGQDGSRGTKTLIFILISGFLTLRFVFSKNINFTQNEKLLLIIFYIYSLISFKNALGRSDGPHIMLASDWILILLFFYFFYIIFNKKFSKIMVSNYYIKIILSLFIILMISYNLSFEKIINYKHNFVQSKNNNDSSFIRDERLDIINKISLELSDVNCVQNFTGDLSLPYLLKKYNCTFFISPWLASGKKFEQIFIEELEKKKVKYIIYNSPIFEVDGIKTSERLKIVNTYIKKNYTVKFNKNDYVILSLIN